MESEILGPTGTFGPMIYLKLKWLAIVESLTDILRGLPSIMDVFSYRSFQLFLCVIFTSIVMVMICVYNKRRLCAKYNEAPKQSSVRQPTMLETWLRKKEIHSDSSEINKISASENTTVEKIFTQSTKIEAPELLNDKAVVVANSI